jgi:hypothetical protein
MRMKPLSRTAFVALVLAGAGCSEDPLAAPGDAMFNPRAELAVTANATVFRPFEDFLNTQDTFCWPDDDGGCLMFEASGPNMIAFAEVENWHLGWADYAGLQNAWIEAESGGAMSLGTVVTGTIKETALDDGRALIQLNLKAKNALFWVNQFVDFGDFDPMYFGARPLEVLAGAEPALGNVNMMVEFINTAPGAPIPDLVQLTFFPEPEQEIVSMRITSLAQGILREASGYPEGTPGIAKIVMVNLEKPQVANSNWDAWPAEFVWFSPQTGNLNR